MLLDCYANVLIEEFGLWGSCLTSVHWAKLFPHYAYVCLLRKDKNYPLVLTHRD